MPAITRSRAAWKSRVTTVSRRWRPAKIAASLQMFARSAPLRPLVCRAISSRFTSAASGLSRGVDVEDRAAALQVGRGHEDLAVEAARAQQRRVELLEHVGGGDHDHVVALAEPVELHQELVERLVLLARDVLAAGGAHRVELVDEDDRRARPCAPGGTGAGCAPRRGPRTSPRTRRRTGRRRWRFGLVGHGLREQRLARARRAVQQDALRHARAQLAEALRVAQELHDLAQLVLGLLDARHVVPADRARRGRLDLLRLGPRHVADRHDQHHEEQAHEDDRQPDHGPVLDRLEVEPGGRRRWSIRSTRKASLPFSRMKSFRPAFTSQPAGTALPGAATNCRSECVATPQFRSPVSSTVTCSRRSSAAGLRRCGRAGRRSSWCTPRRRHRPSAAAAGVAAAASAKSTQASVRRVRRLMCGLDRPFHRPA